MSDNIIELNPEPTDPPIQLPNIPAPMVQIPLDELNTLMRVSQLLIQASILQANPPQIITATNRQDHKAAVNQLFSTAAQTALAWGIKAGILQKQEEEPSDGSNA